MNIKIKILRKIIPFRKRYAVIESKDLFGRFFDFAGMPNNSFTVVLAISRRNAVRRYAEKYKRKWNHYPEFYDSGMLLRKCAMRWGRYCVIDKSKKQTFYN